MAKSLVSVLIRSVGDQNLKFAIESVLEQKYPNLEIILVSAKTSANPDIQHIAEGIENANLKFYPCSEDLNRAQAANIALLKAQGDYLIFLDDDDYFLKNHIIGLVTALELHPAYIAAFSDCAYLNEISPSPLSILGPENMYRLWFENFLPIHTVLFRRNIILENHINFDNNLDILEDWDFWLRLSLFGNFKYIRGETAFYNNQDRSGLSCPGSEENISKTRKSIVVKMIDSFDNETMYAFVNWSKHAIHRSAEELLSTSDSLKSISHELAQLNTIKEELVQLNTIKEELGRKNNLLSQNMRHLEETYSHLEETYNGVISSKSWRITKPLRIVNHYQTKLKVQLWAFLARTKNLLRYLVRGDLSGLWRRYLLVTKERKKIKFSNKIQSDSWNIVYSEHTHFLAEMIEETLALHSFSVNKNSPSAGCFNIILTPNEEHRFAPENTFYYQLEQFISESPWFSKKRISALETSHAILEYKIENLAKLESIYDISHPHTYYLPLSGSIRLFDKYAQSNINRKTSQNSPILFYGSWKNSSRRIQMLAEIEKTLNRKITRVDAAFGEDLYTIIMSMRSTPILLNLHHYSDSLLETPRLWEAASLGLTIVSESSPDDSEDELLLNLCTFFASGNASSAAEAILKAEKTAPDFDVYKKTIDQSSDRFKFFMNRFLLGIGSSNLPLRYDIPIKKQAYTEQIWTLTLPETPRRYKNSQLIPGSRRIVGMRAIKGWIACAHSYREMARAALEQGLEKLWIFEDDISITEDFMIRLDAVNQYLDSINDWNVLVGLLPIFDSKKQQILSTKKISASVSIIEMKGYLGMAANCYSKTALEILAKWDVNNGDEQTNTIDQHLQKHLPIASICHPPLVDHSADFQSTLWGFGNSAYEKLIDHAQDEIEKFIKNTSI